MSVKRQLPPVPKSGDQQTTAWMSAVTEILRDLQKQTTLQGQTITKAATATVDVSGLGISKASLGLGNVDNTSDKKKPISDQTAQALAAKLDKAEFERFKSEQYAVGEWDVSTDSEEDIGAQAGEVFKITGAGVYAGKALFVGDYVEFYEDDAGDLDVIIFVDPDRKADKTTDMIAGDGMTGGGTLASDRTFTLGTPGSVSSASTNSVSTDSHTHALADSGVAAATYTKITVDAKGIVTAGTTLVPSDIPGLDWSKITSGKPTTLSGYGITDAQAADSTLAGIALLSMTAGQVAYATGADVFSTFATTTNSRALLGTTDQYGLGTITAAIATDLDTLTGKGQWFRWGSSTTNAPASVGLGNSGVGIHLPRATNGSNDVQLAFDTAGKAAIRACTSGTWGAWFPIYTSNNATPYNTTTATAANMVVTSTGEFQRSTSSMQYKTDVEAMWSSIANALVDQAEPIFYKSLCPADPQDWSWYGLSAEQIADIDPRFVAWKTHEWRTVDEGEEQRQELFELEAPSIEGVFYERLVVPLLLVVKELKERVEMLKNNNS